MGLTVTQGAVEGERGKIIVTLAGEATIGEVDALKGVLLAALAECGELLLDVEELSGADPVLFQLLLAARRSAENQEKKFSLANGHSAVFHGTARSAGFLPADNGDNESDATLWKE